MSTRYARQISLSEIGEEGQQLLHNAHVVIVGCGGLGAIAASYLAGAGVGQITLIDADVPSESNLHRQVFYTPNETQTKAEALAKYIQTFNPGLQLNIKGQMLDKSNIASLIVKETVVLECTDNILCKYLVNDYCHLHQIPMIYGAIYKFDGYVSCFRNQDNYDIHLRDIFPEPDLAVPSCADVGVMNTIAGMIGLLQANEALKYILSLGDSLSGKLLSYHCLTNDQMKLTVSKNWTHDMQTVYDQNNYRAEVLCTDYAITWDEYFQEASRYTLISILEENEHDFSVDQCCRHPMSSFNMKEVKQDKPLVLFCMSGKRSTTLAHKIKTENPALQVYSLQGGLKAYLSFKDAH